MPKALTITDPAVAQAILEEVHRRQSVYKQLVGSAFKKQRAFIEDQSKLKSALCSRRAGKSWGAGLYLVSEAMKTPGVNCLYITLSRSTAKKIMFRDTLQRINKKFDLGLQFNETTLDVLCPNGSRIYLFGMDSAPQDKDKALGQAYSLCIIDECASFKQDLRQIIVEVLQPAMMDNDGTICMIGTPGFSKNIFYDVTEKGVDGWSCHTWLTSDNPFVADEYKKAVIKFKKDNPAYMELPEYHRMYLAKWWNDESAFVYRYNEERNTWLGDPEHFVANKKDYIFLVGCDFGFTDDNAWVVMCYNISDRTQYVVEVHKQNGMLLEEMTKVMQYFKDKYNPVRWVVDIAARQVVEELRVRTGFTLEPSEKVGKVQYIEMLNSDLINGHIQIVPQTCDALIEEMNNLVWNQRKKLVKVYVEESSKPNHCCDAFLYCFRALKHAFAQPKPEQQYSIHTDEGMRQYEEREAQRREKEKKDPYRDLIIDYDRY